jgi:hypothetical protein
MSPMPPHAYAIPVIIGVRLIVPSTALVAILIVPFYLIVRATISATLMHVPATMVIPGSLVPV